MITDLPHNVKYSLYFLHLSKMFQFKRHVSIDEKLERFRGRCIYQYIPKEQIRYFYLYKLEIYAGLQPDGIGRMTNKPKDLVMRLVETIINNGRNVTAGNLFNSIALIEKL